jgi:hypothetical protein
MFSIHYYRHRSEKRHHVADMMSQFVRGTFGGLPADRPQGDDYGSDDDEEQPARRPTLWRRMQPCMLFVGLSFVFVVILSGVLAVVR